MNYYTRGLSCDTTRNECVNDERDQRERAAAIRRRSLRVAPHRRLRVHDTFDSRAVNSLITAAAATLVFRLTYRCLRAGGRVGGYNNQLFPRRVLSAVLRLYPPTASAVARRFIDRCVRRRGGGQVGGGVEGGGGGYTRGPSINRDRLIQNRLSRARV